MLNQYVRQPGCRAWTSRWSKRMPPTYPQNLFAGGRMSRHTYFTRHGFLHSFLRNQGQNVPVKLPLIRGGFFTWAIKYMADDRPDMAGLKVGDSLSKTGVLPSWKNADNVPFLTDFLLRTWPELHAFFPRLKLNKQVTYIQILILFLPPVYFLMKILNYG